MAIPKNGAVPSTKLIEVEPRHFLEVKTAQAYLAMKRDAAKLGISLDIPDPAGAYRSLAVQRDMHARPSAYNLDPNSSVPLAGVGYSSHGLGTRVDIAIGAGRNWAIKNHTRYGFIREFGSSDPGHFKYLYPTFEDVRRAPYTTAEHDAKPGPIYWGMVQALGKRFGFYDGRQDRIPGPKTYKAEIRLTAMILNAAKLGKYTDAVNNGIMYNGSSANFSNYVWLGQEYGRRKGTYRGAVDGKDGPMSKASRVRTLAEWMNDNI